MSWANASYYYAVSHAIGIKVRTGSRIMARAVQMAEMSSEGHAALRRYSTSHAPGVEDGKVLNTSLVNKTKEHVGWATDMDEAFIHSFENDVLLWRGGYLPDSESDAFVSTSLAERKARQFRDRGRSSLSAIVLPAGSPVAIPFFVWSQGDDERTLGVVKREQEVILPRGTSFELQAEIDPLANCHPGRAPAIRIVRALSPVLAPTARFP